LVVVRQALYESLRVPELTAECVEEEVDEASLAKMNLNSSALYMGLIAWAGLVQLLCHLGRSSDQQECEFTTACQVFLTKLVVQRVKKAPIIVKKLFGVELPSGRNEVTDYLDHAGSLFQLLVSGEESGRL
jgi:hypothetical protein